MGALGLSNREETVRTVPPAACLTSWSPEWLAELAQDLLEAEEREAPYLLDFSDGVLAGSSTPTGVRLHIPSVMVVANLLVGRFRHLPIAVRLPDSKALNLQLARGGLFFALANRGGVTWADDVPEEWDRAAEGWIRPFHPNDETMCREALVDTRSPEADSWIVRAAFQRYLLSLMHPHLRPPQHLYRDLRRIAGSWLSGRLDVAPRSEMSSTLVDCVEVFYQIVVNIPDHAGLAREPAGCSLGQVYATLGGGRDSHNRLHFSVLDNGLGIPRQVNAKYRDHERSAEEALQDAVAGNLPRRTGGRGVGLDLVRRIASEYTEGHRGVGGAGRIRIVTSGDEHMSAACLDWDAGRELPATSTIEGVPVVGTIVGVSLGLEQRTRASDSDQLELTLGAPAAV